MEINKLEKIQENRNNKENSNENVFTLLKTCMINCYFYIKSTLSRNFTNLSFHIQVLLMFVPVSLILGLILIITHSIYYETNLIVEYLDIYKSFISHNENILIGFSEYKIKETVNKSFQNLIFMQIYCKELINKNILLDQEIYSDQHADVFYLDLFDKNSEMNEYFNYNLDFKIISEQFLNPKIPSEDDINLKNLMKTLYLITPTLMQADIFQNLKPIMNYIIISFKDDSGDEDVKYLSYPTRKGKFSTIIFSDPFITDNNWFYYIHQEFINSESKENFMTVSQVYESTPLILNSFNEFYLPINQVKFTSNNIKLSFEMITKYATNVISESDYEAYSFINTRNNYTFITEMSFKKFTDDFSVIGNPGVIPISNPEIFNNYFRKGMIPLDENLKKRGYNWDILDFSKFNKLYHNYVSSQNIRPDLLPFIMLYLYDSFYLKIIDEKISFKTIQDYRNKNLFILMMIPPNSETSMEIIKEISHTFNTTDYIVYNYLMNWKTDCLDEYRINQYKILNELIFGEEGESFYEEIAGLYSLKCECIPFYFFDLSNEDNGIFRLRDYMNYHNNKLNLDKFKNIQEKFIYADRMFLPSKCEIWFEGYKYFSSSSNKYHLQFSINQKGLIFNQKMSYLNMYIISDEFSENLFINYSNELRNLVNSLIQTYSILLICIIFAVCFLIFKKFKFIQTKIKEFIKKHKSHIFSLDINKKISLEFTHTRKNQSLLANSVPEKVKKTSFSFHRNSLNQSNSLIKLSTFEESEAKFLNITKHEKNRKSRVLNTIKENEEIENDESALIERGAYSANTKKIQNVQMEEPIIPNKENNYDVKNDEDINLNVSLNRNNIVTGHIGIVPFDGVIHNINITICSADSDDESDESSLNLSDTDVITNLPQGELKRRKSSKIEIDKFISEKSIAGNIYDMIKSCKENELSELLNLIILNSFLFKLDTNIDKNIYENEILIQNIERKQKTKRKFSILFNDNSCHLEEQYLKQQENTKLIFYEVMSTEIFKLEGQSFNFAFKYTDNENKFSDAMNYQMSEGEIGESSIIRNYIDDIDAELKLIQKESPFDELASMFESNLKLDDVDISENEMLNFENVKSIIYFYLENIFLGMLKRIYIDKNE